MKKIITLFLSTLFLFLLSSCQKADEPSDPPDKTEIIHNATEYFEQMRSGDFDEIYNALPDCVKEQTRSPQTIQKSWDEAITKAGGLPEDIEPEVSCYHPENADQIRVEFVVSCKYENFKVLINYDTNGNLYNYVIWKYN